MSDMTKVAVFGAGVMGAQIAAHCANAGLDVLLFDMAAKEGPDKSAIARKAIQKMLKADPAPFMSSRFARKVRPCNYEEDLALLADCGWAVEAVIERLDIKKDLYQKAAAHLPEDAILSSNTSTLRLSELTKELPPGLQKRFMITHFFNPPRYMRLLEFVTDHGFDQTKLQHFARFCRDRLGKTVIFCHDTPGFIANRIGAFWLQASIKAAIDLNLSVEEADAVMGRPFGFPKTGVFGLIDLVGVDLIPYVDGSLANALPEDDRYHLNRSDPALITRMIAEGYTGRKGKGGFYRLVRDGAKKTKEALDLQTGEYRKSEKPVLASLAAAAAGGGSKAILLHKDKGGEYARRVIAETLGYAVSIASDIADDISAIDKGMRLGYNWKYGPFELIDKMGVEHFAGLLKSQDMPIPLILAKAGDGFYHRRDGVASELDHQGSYKTVERGKNVLLLEDIKARSEPLIHHSSASLWDLDDGVFCFEIHTKLNTIDETVLDTLAKSLGHTLQHGKALVIANQGSQFSAGANIGLALFAANISLWPTIEQLVKTGQNLFRTLKYSKIPVVAAPFNLSLGGGCEICLAANKIVAHAETYMGLVETGVGIVPAWGGCAEMIARYQKDPKMPKGPVAATARAFETIGLAKVAKSAFEAKELGFLSADDRIVFDFDQLLATAKSEALAMVDGFKPPEPPEYVLAGKTAKAAISLALHDFDLKGQLTPHDHQVADHLSDVLSGGAAADHTQSLKERDILNLEAAAFMRLIKTEPTLERMAHTLSTGKPLRN